MELFLSDLETNLSRFKNTIVLGDFNINILDKESSVTEQYMDTVYSSGYVLLNNSDAQMATRVSNTISTTIDHCLTDMVDLEFNLSISDCDFSDHKELFINFNKINETKKAPSAAKTIIII